MGSRWKVIKLTEYVGFAVTQQIYIRKVLG
jgi:hypothetical protein